MTGIPELTSVVIVEAKLEGPVLKLTTHPIDDPFNQNTYHISGHAVSGYDGLSITHAGTSLYFEEG